MQNIMMMLGSYQFGLSTAAYQELMRSTEYRWPAQELFGQIAALQSTGPGADQITINGFILGEFRGGIGQLDDLRALANEQLPQLLIDGRGGILGEWVIEKVDEGQSVFVAHGAPLKQTFTMQLRKYSDDEGDGGLAFQLASSLLTPQLQSSSAIADNAIGSMGQFVTKLTSGLAQIQGIVANVQSAVTPAIGATKQAITAASIVQAASVDAKSLINSIKYINSTAAAEAALGNLARISGQAVTSANAASSVLNTVVGAMTANGETSQNIGIVRNTLVDVNRLAVSVTSLRSQTDGVYRGFIN